MPLDDSSRNNNGKVAEKNEQIINEPIIYDISDCTFSNICINDGKVHHAEKHKTSKKRSLLSLPMDDGDDNHHTDSAYRNWPNDYDDVASGTEDGTALSARRKRSRPYGSNDAVKCICQTLNAFFSRIQYSNARNLYLCVLICFSKLDGRCGELTNSMSDVDIRALSNCDIDEEKKKLDEISEELAKQMQLALRCALKRLY